MIPKILHYCWFLGNPLTPLAEECLASWKFAMPDGSLDMTTNVDRMGRVLQTKGFVPSRNAQYLPEYGLRIYTHDYFFPITSTRVMRKTRNTYSIHYFAESWRDGKRASGWRNWMITREIVNAMVQIKRWINGE